MGEGPRWAELKFNLEVSGISKEAWGNRGVSGAEQSQVKNYNKQERGVGQGD